jgi:two-component system, sensor histidine kinase and response regulator
MDEVNILAVDDTEENLVALATLLKRPGLRLVEARSGREALEALLARDFALALLDVNMPEMDGFELAELMRGSERTREVPIIFVSAALPDAKRVFRGYEAGAVDFLFKPLDPYLLASKVEVFAQLHRQKQQLARQLDQIRQAQAMSDLFVAVLGHDLRNPLSNIAASAALLEQMPGDMDETSKRARTIKRASIRMERLIKQMLDFALARVKGGIPVRPVDTNLADLARQALSEFDVVATNRVRSEFFGDTSGRWDPDRMVQVISNLVSNALEHGESEGLVLLRVDGREDRVRIDVRNRGTIEKAKLDLLFSAFKPRGLDSRGIGLGLYIVDQIVRAHGGAIAVRSDEHDGTTFELELQRRTG